MVYTNLSVLNNSELQQSFGVSRHRRESTSSNDADKEKEITKFATNSLRDELFAKEKYDQANVRTSRPVSEKPKNRYDPGSKSGNSSGGTRPSTPSRAWRF
jgi:hypothetical protein